MDWIMLTMRELKLKVQMYRKNYPMKAYCYFGLLTSSKQKVWLLYRNPSTILSFIVSS